MPVYIQNNDENNILLQIIVVLFWLELSDCIAKNMFLQIAQLDDCGSR